MGRHVTGHFSKTSHHTSFYTTVTVSSAHIEHQQTAELEWAVGRLIESDLAE